MFAVESFGWVCLSTVVCVHCLCMKLVSGELAHLLSFLSTLSTCLISLAVPRLLRLNFEVVLSVEQVTQAQVYVGSKRTEHND